MWVTSRWIMDRLKYFKTEFNIQCHTWDWMMLRPWAIREHFVSGAYLRIYLSDCLQIVHTTLLGGTVVPFGVYEFWPTFGSVGPYYMTYLDLWHTLRFQSRSRLKNYWADYSHIGNMTVIGPVVFEICNIIAHRSTWSLRSQVVSFQVFVP